MNQETKIFFDAEFTGLNKYTSLISIGMITDTGKTFYAEFNDYNTLLVDTWIRTKVIKNLKFNDKMRFYSETFGNDRSTDSVEMKGDKISIRYKLKEWLDGFNSDIQFYADVCHYDFVLLIDLLADSARELPENISASCHDINQDIAKYFNISEKEAFDKSREDIISDNKIDWGVKHNSLYDAIVARAIANKISV